MNSKNKTIVITGANGFIGSHLVRFYQEKKWDVRALQRKPPEEKHNNITYHMFSLPNNICDESFAGAGYAVHCAYQEYNSINRDSDMVNFEGTKKIIEICRKHSVKLIFLSSFSAHPEAESHYGKNKLELESLFDTNKDCTLRPGLVLGRGGLFGEIVGLIKRAKIIPIADSGSQPLQIILMDDLCKLIETVIQNNISGRYYAATTQVYKMKDLYLQIMNKLQLKRFFLPVPLAIVQVAVRFMELLRIPFGVTSENVSGLKCLMSFDTSKDLEKLGVELHSLEDAIDRLL